MSPSACCPVATASTTGSCVGKFPGDYHKLLRVFVLCALFAVLVACDAKSLWFDSTSSSVNEYVTADVESCLYVHPKRTKWLVLAAFLFNDK